MERNQEITVFSMFTGVGGFEEGIHEVDPKVRFIGMSEIEPHACDVLRKHYKEVKNYGDATKINPEELDPFNILCAGFPCQSFSIAGKRLGFEDTRGTLFYEIASIAKSRKPEILFLENVKGLLNHESGKTFEAILSTLDELGYDAEWELLNSRNFGVPQNRERVFIIGHIRGKPWRPIFPVIGEDRTNSKRDGLQELTSGKSQGSRVYNPEGTAVTLASEAGGLGAKTGLYAIPVLTPDRAEKRQDGRRAKTAGEPSFTLTAQDKQGVMVGKFVNQPKYGEYKEGDLADTLTNQGKSSRQHIVQLTEARTEEAKKIRSENMKAGKDWSPRRGKELQERTDDTANCLTATEGPEMLLKVTTHSLQPRSADRPSLQKTGGKGGGSGHLAKDDGTAHCLDTGNCQAIEMDRRIRKLTPIECERLQGFPDNWTKEGITEEGKITKKSDNQRYKMMGNAVTVPVISEIFKRIKRNMEEWNNVP